MASKYFQQVEGIVGIKGIIRQRTSEPFAYHHLHGLGLTHAGKEQRKNIKIMWENRVSSHSRLMVFSLSSSGKHRLTGHTVAVYMLVMAQDSTKDGNEQFRQKNNMGARKKKKKLASINIKKIKNCENHSSNGREKRSKCIENKAGCSGRL